MAGCITYNKIQQKDIQKDIQTRRKGQYKPELTLSPRLYDKALIIVITAIGVSRAKYICNNTQKKTSEE